MTLRIKYKSYKVGPGHPPKEFQFKPGQSGNPNGRPIGRKSMHAIIREEMSRMIIVKEGKEVSEIPIKQALGRRWVNEALKGNLKAAKILIQFMPNETDGEFAF